MGRLLSESEARDVLNVCSLGHLGCIANGEPYVVPINYIIEHNSIYSHSLPGLKIDAMRLQPSVCLQVEQIENGFNWRSALAFGEYEEILELNERRSVLRKLMARFPELTPVESTMSQDASEPDRIIFQIRIHHVTGVAEGQICDSENLLLISRGMLANQ